MVFAVAVFLAAVLLTGHAQNIGGDDMFRTLLDMGTGIDIYANEVIIDVPQPAKKTVTSIKGTNTASSELRPFLQTTRVIKELNALGVSTDELFAAKNITDLINRSRARVLGPWMRQVIHDSFNEKNPEVVYKLLGRISDLLQLSRVGCKGFACSVPVLFINSKYQDLMYKASQISILSTKTSLRLLKYIRVALMYPKHAIKFLEISERITNQYAQQFGYLAEAVEDLEKKSEDAMIKTKSISQEIIEKFRQLKKENDNVTIQLANQTARRDQLAIKIDQEKGRIDKIEADRKVLLSKYLQAADTEVKDTEECDSKVLAQYKLVQNEVKQYITLDKYQKRAIKRRSERSSEGDACIATSGPGAGQTCVFPFKHIGEICPGPECCNLDNDSVGSWCATKVDDSGKMHTYGYCKNTHCEPELINEKVDQEVEEKTSYVKAYERINDKIDRKCWTKKDAVHLQHLQSKMASIQSQLNDSRPAYMELLKEVAKSRREKVDVVGMVAAGMAKIKIFQRKTKEKEGAVDSLEMVVRSLTLVKTILKEAKKFWVDTAKFIKKFLIPGMKAEKKFSNADIKNLDDDAVIFGIINKGSVKLPESQTAMIQRTGLYWLLFGSMNARAYMIMERNKRKIRDDLLRKMTESRKKEILKEAEATINEIIKLHDTLKERKKLEEKEMDEALEAATKYYKELQGEPASINEIMEKEGEKEQRVLSGLLEGGEDLGGF